MEFATQPAKFQSLAQMHSGANKHAQNVFSEVLRGAGRPGFASTEQGTEQGPASEPLAERIQEDWGDRNRIARLERYASSQAQADLGENFGQILAKAHEQGGYVAPHAFLSGPSDTEQIPRQQYSACGSSGLGAGNRRYVVQ